MEVLISRLMAPEVSTAIATGLGLTVCVFTVLVVVFLGDPKTVER
jgi:hypothetical protein